MRQNLPDPNYFMGKDVPGLQGYVVAELIGSGANAHVFRAHSEIANNNAACKVIPRANLVGSTLQPPTWHEEIDKANVLRSPSVVKVWQVLDWKDETAHIDCVVLCSDYIPGGTLEKYIETHKRDISVSFVEKYLTTMLSFLYDMANKKVQHGDLHAKNLLVEDRRDVLGEPQYAFRVTDFGVASATSDTDFKDDYDQTAAVLRRLLENVNFQSADARDRYAFNVLNNQFLARHLVERDLTRDELARRPKELYNRLQQIDEDFGKAQSATESPGLVSPFDYLNCEQIGDSHLLLKALYSESFLGLSEIENNRNNLVLTGPRGCGKSTVFRSLNLRHRIIVKYDDPGQITYIGVYYRCDDLYFAFPRYKTPHREEAYDIPIHYVTATLVGEALDTVALWGRTYFQEEIALKEQRLADSIWQALEMESPRDPTSSTFRAIGIHLQKERKRAAMKQRFVNDMSHPMRDLLGPDALMRVCEILHDGLTFLQDRPFYFLVDDYSSPKITPDLQKNLNRLLMQRNPYCFFKLSTESPVSFVREDIDGKAYVEKREFDLLNLGLVYLTASDDTKLRFIEDVFERRFKASEGYPVSTLEELIGDTPTKSYNELALEIRGGAKNPDVWGRQMLSELCSGDIFYIISLVGKMVAQTGGKEALAQEKATPKISPEIQTKAVRAEAGGFLDGLRRSLNGELLVQVVTAFGNVAHAYILYMNSKNEKGSPPHLASRIEPYEELNLSEKAQEVYDELLRYSLFIEDPRGKSRRGRVVPRLYLRRCLLPHFNLTFSKRDSVELEAPELEMLFLRPQEFEKSHRMKKKLDAKQAGGLFEPRSSEGQ